MRTIGHFFMLEISDLKNGSWLYLYSQTRSMNSSKLNRIIWFVNIFAFFYFCFLVVASTQRWDAQAIQIVSEILTLPLIAIVGLSLPYCLYHLIKKTHLKFTILTLGVCTLSIAVIILATINQM